MAVSNLVSSSLSASDLITQPGWTQLGSNTTSASVMTIGSLPSTYRTLRVWWRGYDTTGTNTTPYFRLNNDLTGYFTTVFMGMAGSTPSSSHQSGQVQLAFFQVVTGNYWTGYIDIEDYASVTATKVVRGRMIGAGTSTWAYEFDSIWTPPSSTAITSVGWTGSAGTTLGADVFRVLGAK